MSTQTVVASDPPSSSSAEQVASQKHITLHVELAGGLELLWKGVRQHTVHLPVKTSSEESQKAPTCGNLIAHLATAHLGQHPQRSMFVLDDEYSSSLENNNGKSMTVRPGILVMVNEADWALEGEEACALADGDEVVFVSTLHGG